MSGWRRFLIIDVKRRDRDMPCLRAGRHRPRLSRARRPGLVPFCPMTWLDALADKAIDCVPPTRAEALAVLGSSDDDLMDVVAAAFRVRRQFFGRRVKLNYLVNIKY